MACRGPVRQSLSREAAPLDQRGRASLFVNLAGHEMALLSVAASSHCESSRNRASGCSLRANAPRKRRWEYEAVLDTMQERLDRAPQSMRIRRQTAEHPFGTIKAWMGATHFRLRTLEKVSAEMSLHVLAYNLKRMITILGTQPLIQAMRAA